MRLGQRIDVINLLGRTPVSVLIWAIIKKLLVWIFMQNF